MIDEIPINNQTTILDVKNRLQAWEGIPTDQQRLCAECKQLLRDARTVHLQNTLSQELYDHDNVKEIMNQYNSKHLVLTLALRRERQNKG